MFKEVQWGNVNNMKIMFRNMSSPFSLAYPNFCIRSWAGAKHSHFPNNFPPPYLLTGIATLVIGSVPLQNSSQEYNQLIHCLLLLHYTDSWNISDQYSHQILCYSAIFLSIYSHLQLSYYEHTYSISILKFLWNKLLYFCPKSIFCDGTLKN